MKKTLALLMCLCSFYAHAEERALTKEERIAIERSVKERLKDPDSAKFKHYKFIKNQDSVHVYCGMVNAKNSYGGYVGLRPFQSMIAVDTRGVLVAYTLPLDTPEVIYQLCVEKGYFL